MKPKLLAMSEPCANGYGKANASFDLCMHSEHKSTSGGSLLNASLFNVSRFAITKAPSLKLCGTHSFLKASSTSLHDVLWSIRQWAHQWSIFASPLTLLEPPRTPYLQFCTPQQMVGDNMCSQICAARCPAAGEHALRARFQTINYVLEMPAIWMTFKVV